MKAENLVDAVILVCVTLFLLNYFNPSLVFQDKQLVGGDTAAHYFNAWYLHNVLLPSGEVIGWAPEHLMGFPMFQYYFPLSFLVAAVFGYVVGLNIAFRFATVLGVFLLPLASYYFLKKIGLKFPAPAIASILTLPILFNEVSTHNGVYILDVLSGQFSNSLSLSLLLFFFGFLYEDVSKKKFTARTPLAFGATTLAHAMLTPFFGVFQSAYFFLFSRNRGAVAKHLILVFSLGFLITAFWSMPFLLDTEFKYAETIAKEINADYFQQVAGDQGVFLLFQTLALIGAAIVIIRRDKDAGFLLWGTIVLLALFSSSLFVSHVGNLPVLSRYFPIYYLYLTFLSAYALGTAANAVRYAKYAAPLAVAAVVFIAILGGAKIVPQWIKWNYSGIEPKLYYAQYMEMNNFLKNTEFKGRISTEMLYATNWGNALGGGPFTWDLIPFFSGKPGTGSGTEGVYSLSFRVNDAWLYNGLLTWDADKIANKSILMNVKYLLKSSENKVSNIEKYFVLRKRVEFDRNVFMEAYESKVNDGSYTYVPRYMPVYLINQSDVVRKIQDWFGDDSLNQVPMVLDREASAYAAQNPRDLPNIPVEGDCIVKEEVKREQVSFETNCPGKPHIIKISFHPGWRAETGEKIFLVSPNHILLYPASSHVVIKFGATIYGIIGTILSYAGVIFCILLLFSKKVRKKIEKFVYETPFSRLLKLVQKRKRK